MINILDTEIYWKNDVPSGKVEYGNTIAVDFHLRIFEKSKDAFRNISESDEIVEGVKAFLKDKDLNPVTTEKNISDSTLEKGFLEYSKIEKGIYRVQVPLSDIGTGEIKINGEYFVEFQWEYSGVKKLIREKIRVVDNIPEMRRI